MSSDRKESSKSPNPFVSEWSGKQKLSSSDFLKVFKKYDRNNDGYIEGKEIDPFLEDLMSEKELDKSDMKALKEFKEQIMAKYDINKDTKIELKELSKILPTEENFLLQFRRKCADLTSVDFMKIWNHYDADGNGYLDSGEIQAFCYDLMSKKKGRRVTKKSLEEFTTGILELYDKNKDGKIEIGELQKLMPVEQNFLSRVFEKQKNLSDEEFNKIFDHYDQDEDGTISEHELTALIRDLVTHSGQRNDNPSYLEKVKKDLMKHMDKDKDSRIQRKELSVLFTSKKAAKIWK